MGVQDGYKRYQQTDVNTASQGKLVVMLYEGAIRFLSEAEEHIGNAEQIELVHTKLIKAQEIINELLVSLNYDAGEMAKRLASIYTYMNRKLVEANVNKTKPEITEVKKYLIELKDAWAKAAAQPSNANAPVQKPVSEPSANEDKGSKINIAG